MNYHVIPGTGIIMLHNPAVPVGNWQGRWKFIAEFDDHELAQRIAADLNRLRA